MREPNNLADVLHFLRNVVIIDLCIFVAIALVCWFIGALTVRTYGNLLELAGGIAIVIGAMDFTGGLGAVGSPRYQYGRSAGSVPIDERTIQDVNERRKSYRFTFLMAVVGLVSFGFGILLQSVFSP